jgi:hypothetical protein
MILIPLIPIICFVEIARLTAYNAILCLSVLRVLQGIICGRPPHMLYVFFLLTVVMDTIQMPSLQHVITVLVTQGIS